MLSRMTTYILVGIPSLSSPSLAFLMHRLCCVLNGRCASSGTPSQHVARELNHMILFPMIIVAVSFARWFLLWPCLRVNSAASIFAVTNCSPLLLAHSMLCGTHLSSIVMTWLTSLPVATQRWSSEIDSPFASDMYSLTNLIQPEV